MMGGKMRKVEIVVDPNAQRCWIAIDGIPLPDQNDLAMYGKEVMDLTTCGLRSM